MAATMSTSPRAEPPAKTVLFVYGTLKRGQRNHQLIADQEFLGEAVTQPRYRVFDLGPYPGLVADDTTGVAVRGELWAVGACCLAELDDFEEVPGLFVRVLVAIAGRDGEVFAYFWNRPVPPGAASGSDWPLGCGPVTP
jgi:gamma-glutamylaminecyclotransferase